ncbi:tRNA uridine-5-carboxymethylaminomethyl(34) synthesis GTPase MnmE [soil metagenome]
MDTIVALSTPQGTGAIGVVRLSGPQAIQMVSGVFKGKNLTEQPANTLHFGSMVRGGVVLDEVVVALFRAPHSYTKEDVAEISCHGSPYILQQVIELLIEQGARPAKPGEFTLRAFLNGRMDLSQAEAVADLIASHSEASHKLAIQQMRGGFSNRIKELRGKLVHFASMVELELDFGEEDVEFADRSALETLVNELNDIITRLIRSFQLGNVIKTGVSTVIAGRPNSGKSTLLNRLLNEERAIVSDTPGTTRDTIEEAIVIGGILFRLIDTAGIREATDAIEKIGVERTFQKISQSAIVVYLFDASTLSPQLLKHDLSRLKSAEIPVLIVGNKIDALPDRSMLDSFVKEFPHTVFLSSLTGEGIAGLEQALIETLAGQGLGIEDTIVSNARHYDSLLHTQEALNAVLAGIANRTTSDFLALDIRRGLHHLGEITGEITTDDLLDNIFSKFCIGK